MRGRRTRRKMRAAAAPREAAPGGKEREGMTPAVRLGMVAAAVFAVNVPFGWWRAGTRKFSRSWFLAVHAPVPLVVLLRIVSGLGLDKTIGNPVLSPGIAVLTTVALGLIGFVAGYFPARDAARLDPVVAMKV